jgi:hypothetical protein
LRVPSGLSVIEAKSDVNVNGRDPAPQRASAARGRQACSRPAVRRPPEDDDRFPVERHMREAKVMQIFEGTDQIQRLVIARSPR